ncbi:hypothetical protein [Streptacidiphilus carbonis]|uniref:hypothetical protein n=1 Tax=Streptacidiphilus carbonis TaxID=105422 RepID=UPI000B290CBB|nr:hypothetical protein [Streptacidiphilus carbonis]
MSETVGEERLSVQALRPGMTADDFNLFHPVGTRVVAYPGFRPDVVRGFECPRLETVTRTPAWTLGDGEPVVSVEGYAGGIALTHIDLITGGAS